jgi:CDP-diacylglycerol pyrophosphatase
VVSDQPRIGSRATTRRQTALVAGFILLELVAIAAAVAPAFADRLVLWRIVHEQCEPHAEAGQKPPKPCDEVELGGGEAKGDAVLKDLRGIAQLLLIPTARVTGIEDPLVLADDAPNYFAAAWRARADMTHYLKTAPPREAIAVAINSEFARSQDQLHLHVDCLRPEVAKTLADYAPHFDEQWRPMTVDLHGRRYWARKVESADLDGVLPFRLLAEQMPGASAEMGHWSLAAAAINFQGKPGFALLADHAGLEGGGHAEDLQDHECAFAR